MEKCVQSPLISCSAISSGYALCGIRGNSRPSSGLVKISPVWNILQHAGQTRERRRLLLYHTHFHYRPLESHLIAPC